MFSTLQENRDVISFREYLLGSVCLERLAAKKEVAGSALKVLCNLHNKFFMRELAETLQQVTVGT